MAKFKHTGQYSLSNEIPIPHDGKCEQCGTVLMKGRLCYGVTPSGGGEGKIPDPSFYFCDWSCGDTKIHGASDEPYCKAHSD